MALKYSHLIIEDCVCHCRFDQFHMTRGICNFRFSAHRIRKELGIKLVPRRVCFSRSLKKEAVSVAFLSSKTMRLLTLPNLEHIEAAMYMSAHFLS
jgi:hypothetical protein